MGNRGILRAGKCRDSCPGTCLYAYREVIRLRDIEEFDTEQTAELLGLSSANIKIRLHRARQALRELLARKLLRPLK